MHHSRVLKGDVWCLQTCKEVDAFSRFTRLTRSFEGVEGERGQDSGDEDNDDLVTDITMYSVRKVMIGRGIILHHNPASHNPPVIIFGVERGR